MNVADLRDCSYSIRASSLLQEETGFSFYDSLVVAAALESGCSALLSEDLQSGRNVHGVALVNPFADSPAG